MLRVGRRGHGDDGNRHSITARAAAAAGRATIRSRRGRSASPTGLNARERAQPQVNATRARPDPRCGLRGGRCVAADVHRQPGRASTASSRKFIAGALSDEWQPTSGSTSTWGCASSAISTISPTPTRRARTSGLPRRSKSIATIRSRCSRCSCRKPPQNASVQQPVRRVQLPGRRFERNGGADRAPGRPERPPAALEHV